MEEPHPWLADWVREFTCEHLDNYHELYKLFRAPSTEEDRTEYYGIILNMLIHQNAPKEVLRSWIELGKNENRINMDYVLQCFEEIDETNTEAVRFFLEEYDITDHLAEDFTEDEFSETISEIIMLMPTTQREKLAKKFSF